MKRWIETLFIGSDGKTSGIIALFIVSLIVLGCTCGNFDLGNLGEKTPATNDAPDEERGPGPANYDDPQPPRTLPMAHFPPTLISMQWSARP